MSQILNLKYSELSEKIPTLTADTYDLTVDCTGVNNETIKGFGMVLGTATEGVLFNLTPTNVGSDVTDAKQMFFNCSSLTSIDTNAFTSVTNASDMFYGCSSLTSINTSGFTKVTDAPNMFNNCGSLTSITWGDSFRPTQFNGMFTNVTATKTITASADSQKWIKDNASNMSLFFYVFGEKSEPIILTYAQLYTELASLEPHYTYKLTVNCEGVDNQTLRRFGSKLTAAPANVYFNLTPTNVGSDVTDASSMFSGCSKLTSIDTSGFTKVTDTGGMFNGCSDLTKVTGTSAFTNVTNAHGMFYQCSNLTSIDTSGFTSVTDAGGMFHECSSLTSIDTSAFTSVTDASHMFEGCSNLTEVTGTSAFTKVTDASAMFALCSNLTSIDTSGFTSVTDATYMFFNCSNLTSIDTSRFTKVTDASNMFSNCTALKDIIVSSTFSALNSSSIYDGVTPTTIRCIGKNSEEIRDNLIKNASTTLFNNVTVTSWKKKLITYDPAIKTKGNVDIEGDLNLVGNFYQNGDIKEIATVDGYIDHFNTILLEKDTDPSNITENGFYTTVVGWSGDVPGKHGKILHINHTYKSHATQVYFNLILPDKMAIRTKQDGVWYPWKEIANIESLSETPNRQDITVKDKATDINALDWVTRHSPVTWSLDEITGRFDSTLRVGDYVTLKTTSDTGKNYIGLQQVFAIYKRNADTQAIEQIGVMPRSYYIENALPAGSTVGDKAIATTDDIAQDFTMASIGLSNKDSTPDQFITALKEKYSSGMILKVSYDNGSKGTVNGLEINGGTLILGNLSNYDYRKNNIIYLGENAIYDIGVKYHVSLFSQWASQLSTTSYVDQKIKELSDAIGVKLAEVDTKVKAITNSIDIV